MRRPNPCFPAAPRLIAAAFRRRAVPCLTARRLAALVAALVTVACGSDSPDGASRVDAAVRDAALRELFRVRERAAVVVLWADPVEAGPVFSTLAPTIADARLAPAPRTVPPPLARDTATLADLEALFRDAPDGWAAFRTRWPFSAGLVEVGPVRRVDDSTATVVIGRSCGEHCRMAWRVEVRVAGAIVDSVLAAGLSVTRVESLAVPRGG